MKQLVVGLFVSLVVCITSAHAANTLRVVSAGPVGEVATRAEANEIRVVFSEPMVAIGRVPAQVTAPFFKVQPAIRGSFRWSGTTTLIFTPDRKEPLPFATEFTVTIDKAATSLAGNTLDRVYSFSFMTPVVRLNYPDWYRKGGRANAAVVIALRFNQPVDAASILPHLKLKTAGHGIEIPELTAPARERLARIDPQAIAAWQAKKAKAEAAAQSDGATVLAFAATEWDKKRFPPSPDLVVLETKPGVPSDSWLKLSLDPKLTKTSSSPGELQEYTVELEPTLFAGNPPCVRACDPDSRNGIPFRAFRGIPFDSARKAVTVTDITNPAAEKVLASSAPSRDYDYPSNEYGLDELGYSLEPARRYAIRVDAGLTASDGQTLGHTWMTVVENGNRSAFISLAGGHGVWESAGGSILPFHARNYRSVSQWLAPIELGDLMPALQKLRSAPASTPPGVTMQAKPITMTPNRVQSVGIDLGPVLGRGNRGIAWAAVQPRERLAGASEQNSRIQTTVIQSTNLGISVKDSPLNAVVMVTRLDTGAPVSGAVVSFRNRKNGVAWSGATDERGLAVAPRADFRRSFEGEQPDRWSMTYRSLTDLSFIVTAEKDGDVAYVGSDWVEGIQPWTFNASYDISEADPLLRGTVFTDRGVYKLGEEIQFKVIARSDTPQGMRLLPGGTPLEITLYDSHSNEVDKRTIKLSEWSSAEWTFRLPAAGALGNYSVSATTGPEVEPIRADILVAAYRRPDFRVDATLTSNSTLAGTQLQARIAGRYLFGGAMSAAPVRWTYSKRGLYSVPPAIADRWSDRFTFVGWDDADERGDETIRQAEAKLDAAGDLALALDTEKTAGAPFEYRVEGVVTDVTRQQIAGRASFRVDPAPWYVGVKTPSYFTESKNGLDTEIIVAGLDGLGVAAVPVKIELKKIQWTGVRQAEGDGFYEWDSERKEVAAGEWSVTSAATPVPLHIDLEDGGEYLLIASASDAEGRSTKTHVWFYAMGAGYTAWKRYDHNRIDLVAEKATWKPGETARILVKSPWESATALLTTEREGVRTWQPFEITSTQQTITVPITEADIPNVFVSVLLVKGRTSKEAGRDGSDPGKPAFRLGYVELTVEDASKRLKVDVKANADDYRPGSKSTIDVTVRDTKGAASQAEVTLWAVDYGVLSLTAYRTPDVLGSVWLRKALQVATIDSRQRIVSRRALIPKGGTDGGGGGVDSGPGMLRKDFRVLAFWVGSLVTDADGKARTQITLPESLTTYRIMAVAADRASRFGWAEDEIKINQPLMLTPAWPRFLSSGDKAHFGGVVHNQSKRGGRATVTIRSLDPSILSFDQEKAEVEVAAGRAAEVRFAAVAKMAGEARIQMRVKMGREADAFEDVIPVRVLVSPETMAAYGSAKPGARESLRLPENIVPGFGGLRVDLSSTAMVGLGEGARYLIEYPYGCAEQRASAALALVLASELGGAFPLPGVDASKVRADAQRAVDELPRFQCQSGAFAFWAGSCSTGSPYLTSWMLHVLLRAKENGFRVDQGVIDRGAELLMRELQTPPQQNAAWMPSYAAWNAFATHVLAGSGRNVDSLVTRVYGFRERMPVFGLAHLLDAMVVKGEKSARRDDLQRRITNSILIEGGNAFVNEPYDPYLVWLWSSSERSTAIVLGSLVRAGVEEEMAVRLVRWLMNVRKQGRWGNTQENAWAMQSLIDYYKRFESEVPDFTALVTLGSEPIAREPFQGRSTEARSHQFSMQQLLAKGAPGQTFPLTFTREGTGTLFYMARLRYALNPIGLTPLDQGFSVERFYTRPNGEPAGTSFKAGELIQVTLRIRNTKERRFVAVTDPIPAGTEPVETAFATTARDDTPDQRTPEGDDGSWMSWWRRGGFDHVERHDDRVAVFATRLAEGNHQYSYLVRATTAGTFVTAPTHAEEMYEPEVFGRTGTVVVEVAK